MLERLVTLLEKRTSGCLVGHKTNKGEKRPADISNVSSFSISCLLDSSQKQNK